jgi:hypothetical protein
MTVVGASPAAASAIRRPSEKPTFLRGSQAADALLSQSDMPRGWSVGSRGRVAAASPSGALCDGPSVLWLAESLGGRALTSIGFHKDMSTGVTEVIYEFPNSQSAQDLLQAEAEKGSSCTSGSFPGSAPNLIYQFDVAAIPLKPLGDARWGDRETDHPFENGVPSQPSALDTIFVRVGNHVVQLNRRAPFGDAPELNRYAQVATNKLRSAAQRAKTNPATTAQLASRSCVDLGDSTTRWSA